MINPEILHDPFESSLETSVSKSPIGSEQTIYETFKKETRHKFNQIAERQTLEDELVIFFYANHHRGRGASPFPLTYERHGLREPFAPCVLHHLIL